LMGADEEGTHERLQGHLRELIDPKIAEHRGRVVKNTGDGFLAEFASVVDAVRCAGEVQRGMAARNSATPLENRIDFRLASTLATLMPGCPGADTRPRPGARAKFRTGTHPGFPPGRGQSSFCSARDPRGQWVLQPRRGVASPGGHLAVPVPKRCCVFAGRRGCCGGRRCGWTRQKPSKIKTVAVLRLGRGRGHRQMSGAALWRRTTSPANVRPRFPAMRPFDCAPRRFRIASHWSPEARDLSDPITFRWDPGI
jgi:hypothetical protein